MHDELIAEHVKNLALIPAICFAVWLIVSTIFFIHAYRTKNLGDSTTWHGWWWQEIRVTAAAIFTPWWALDRQARISHLDEVMRHRGWDK